MRSVLVVDLSLLLLWINSTTNISNLEAFWDLGFIFFSDEEVWLGEYYSYWSGFWIFGRLSQNN